jgi:site-specific recombinase XerD
LSEEVPKAGQETLPALPPVIAGSFTPEVKERVESFFHSVAAIFDAWVNRRKSEHTRRAYRGDVMAFVEFQKLVWPRDAAELLRVSILTVHSFKDHMGKHGGAPKTINRRISSLSSFYKFLSGAAAELRLPITVPNPAHAQFIAREASDPVEETRALSETRARQFLAMVAGESVIELRDRAILKFYLYTGARIETGCELNVEDFHQDGDEATIRFHLKGNRYKTKGIHFSAAEAIAEYIRAAGIESGPLFRPSRSRHSEGLASRRLTQRAMYNILMSYFERLPGAMQEKKLLSGERVQVCVYSPHSLRATTATLLVDAGERIQCAFKRSEHRKGPGTARPC